jgi:L-ribulose-5-phosphate 3-epimerase
LIRAIKDIGTGNVFINCDLANLLMYGKANSLDAVKLFGSLIKEFHAKDGKYPDPDNPYELGAEVPIPTGEVDFPAVIAELKKQGFKGAVTIECELNGSRHDYVIKTRKYLQELLDK